MSDDELIEEMRLAIDSGEANGLIGEYMRLAAMRIEELNTQLHDIEMENRCLDEYD
jgi:uncharacterized protein YigA (DUF484 family)